MDSIFTALLGVSFMAAFAIGFFTKRFWSLILSLIFGIVIAFASFRIFLVLPSTQKIGLGIIALIPVMMIIFGALNAAASILGGIIGIFVGKKWKK